MPHFTSVISGAETFTANNASHKIANHYSHYFYTLALTDVPNQFLAGLVALTGEKFVRLTRKTAQLQISTAHLQISRRVLQEAGRKIHMR